VGREIPLPNRTGENPSKALGAGPVEQGGHDIVMRGVRGGEAPALQPINITDRHMN